MTNEENVEIVISKLQRFMKKTVDEFLRKELTRKISDLAESYAPDRAWYIKIINSLYLDYAKYMEAKTAQTVITEVITDKTDDEEADNLYLVYMVDLPLVLSLFLQPIHCN